MTLAQCSTSLLQKVTLFIIISFIVGKSWLQHLKKSKLTTACLVFCSLGSDVGLAAFFFFPLFSGQVEAIIFLTEICKVNPHMKDR